MFKISDTGDTTFFDEAEHELNYDMLYLSEPLLRPYESSEYGQAFHG